MSSRSTVEAQPLSPAPRPPATPANRLVALMLLLSASHFLVDLFAASVNPLWRAFELRLGVPTGGAIGTFVAWSMVMSFGQLAVGLWSDRTPRPWLIWLAPALAVVTISSVGLAASPLALTLLLVVGGFGIAAYHPEAATAAGAVHPAHRSRMMAIFNVCGFLGQAVGPYYSGWLTARFGLTALLWGIVWGLLAVLGLAIGFRRVPVPAAAAPRAVLTAGPRPPLRRGRLLLLLTIGTLRIVPATGVPLVLVYLLEARSAPPDVIGAVQSAFMAGIGAGSLGCALTDLRGRERAALWLPLLAVAPLLLAMPRADGWTLVSLIALTGALTGFTMPVFVSFGQELLPHAPRLASSITMGVSWGLAGGLVALTVWVLTRHDRLPLSFAVFAACVLTSVLLCFRLPRHTGKE